MKLIVAILALLLSFTAVQAQDETMKITLRDGSEVKISIDEVQSLKFTKLDLPEYRRIRTHPSIGANGLGYDFYGTAELDSFHFSRRREGQRCMVAGPGKFGYPPDTLQLFQQLDHNGIGSRGVDSIVFLRFSMNPQLITTLDNHVAINSAWHGDSLFLAGGTVRLITIDTSLRSKSEEILGTINSVFVEINHAGTKVLAVARGSSRNTTGKLVEYDLLNDAHDTLSFGDQITYAMYFPGTDDIVYYSAETSRAGFYRYDRVTKQPGLLISYESDIAPAELIHSFDISRDGKFLLYSTRFRSEIAKLIEHNLSSKSESIIPIAPSYLGRSIWATYNSNASEILFCDYYWDAFREMEGSFAQVGIYSKASNTARLLDTDIDNEWTYISLFPRWSGDDKLISLHTSYIDFHHLYMWGSQLYLMRVE